MSTDAWELRVVSVARTITGTMDYNAKVIKQASQAKPATSNTRKQLSRKICCVISGKMDLPPRIKSKRMLRSWL